MKNKLKFYINNNYFLIILYIIVGCIHPINYPLLPNSKDFYTITLINYFLIIFMGLILSFIAKIANKNKLISLLFWIFLLWISFAFFYPGLLPDFLYMFFRIIGAEKLLLLLGILLYKMFFAKE